MAIGNNHDNKNESIKVVIEIEGGVIRNILSNSNNVEAIVLDNDECENEVILTDKEITDIYKNISCIDFKYLYTDD